MLRRRNYRRTWEEVDELAEEWDGDDSGPAEPERGHLTPEQLVELRQEMEQLRQFHALAKSIIKNSKGEVLIAALRRGFTAAAEAQKNQGAATLQQKAVIFTESRRTQEYLFRVLEQTEFAGKVMLFNGTNTDPTSRAKVEARGYYRLASSLRELAASYERDAERQASKDPLDD